MGTRFEDVIARMARERATLAATIDGPSPGTAAAANKIARTQGLPAETVDRNLERLQRMNEAARMGRLVEQNPRLARPLGDPRISAVARDDSDGLQRLSEAHRRFWGEPPAAADGITSMVRERAFADRRRAGSADGFLDRTGSLLSRGLNRFEQGLMTVGAVINEWGADAPIFSQGQRESSRREAQQLRLRAALLGGSAATPIRGATTWNDIKARPGVGTALAFGLESVIESAPSMLAAAYALPTLVASQAGNIGEDRARNDGRGQASGGDVVTALPAALASSALDALGIGRIIRPGGATIFRRVTRSAATEGLTEVAQGAIEYAGGSVGTRAGFDVSEAADQAVAGALGGVIGGGGLRGLGELSAPVARSLIRPLFQSQAAVAEADALDGMADVAAQSKTRQRDPEAFAALVRALRGEADENVFVPAEAVREYLQSDGLYDREFWDGYSGQIDEAVATGGDVVIPVDQAIAHLSGTPAWEALRDDMRLSPGGMSMRDAAEQDAGYGATVEEAAREIEAERAAAKPRQRVFDDAYTKLTNAGFTPDAARTQAELIAQRYATRAERLGQELTGDEFAAIDVNQVLPAGLAPLRALDNTDVVIAAMRRRRDPQLSRGGPTLLEWIAQRGGIDDTGGDVASMGGDRWHREKRFRRRLIRPGGDARQTSMLQAGAEPGSRFGLDDTLTAAIEAGYFPELQRASAMVGGVDSGTFADKPDNAALLDAIAEELAGRPRVVEEAANDETRVVAEDLAQALDQAGIDSDTASDDAIRQFLQRFGDATPGSAQFEQSAEDTTWARNVDRVVRGEASGRRVRLGRTPPALRTAGLPAGDVYMSSAKLARVRREHPEVSLDIMRALPMLLSEPAAAFPSDRADGSIIVAVEAADADGNPVVVPMIASPDGTNVVLSIYGKSKGADWIAARLARAKRDGAAFYEKSGLADAEPKSDPVSEETSSYSPAPIAAERPAKPAREILSLRPDVKRQFDQSYGDGPRGRVTFQGARTTIDLFERRNLSTFLHETGHIWLEELRADAFATIETDGNEAARQLSADWETVKAWFARSGNPVADDGTIPVEAHEMWARGVERYLMEGKAPTTALRRAFDVFKGWMLTLYQVVDNLRSPITPEIREVMDRLIATDTEIAVARAEQSIGLLFEDAQAAGMTNAEYGAYRSLADDARTEARDALLFRTMSIVRARRTKEYRDQRRELRTEIAEQVNARPEFRALALVRGEMRLDREAVVAAQGADALDLLPRGVPPIYRENGTAPDMVAELAGYRSGGDMLLALMGIEARRREMRDVGDKRPVRDSIIDDETDAVMTDRYGDPLADGSIEREARELVHSDRQGEVIAAELRALSRQRRRGSDPVQSPTPYQAARRWAERKVAEGEVREYASRGAIARYQRSARKAARDAEAAILAGDVDGAFRAKQVQMLNNALVSEATKAADAVDAAVARMSKVAKRRTMKSVDQDYLEQAQSLLEAVELRERSQVSIDRQGAFEAWAREREAEGHDVIVPSSFEASLGTTNYTRLSVERLLGLDAAVAQIMHLGRHKQTLIDGKERREFDAIVGEAVAGAGNLQQRPPSDLMEPSWGDRFRSRVASADAALLKMETVFDWLDGGNSEGVFNRVVFKPIADAEAHQTEMMKRYRDELTGHLKAVPREMVKRWADKVTIPELLNRETGNPFVLARMDLIAMALNMGNQGNVQRLTDGYGWSEAAVRDVLNRELDPVEWQYVQAVWDTLESLWPETAAMERRVNGVEPEKVEATPVETPGGALRGGYYPAIYDPRRSVEAEANAARDSAGLFENIYTRATTRASSTKDRAAKVSRPIHLSLSVMQQHVAEVIHDITHREAIINADRFLHDRRVMRAVDQSLGPEMRKQFRPWLKHIANEFASERAGTAGIEAFLKGMRTNATIVGMGFRVSTILMQVAGYSNSFERVGARWVGEALARTVARPIETGRFVLERSSEVRNRLGNLDRDIRDTIRIAQGSTNPLTEAKRFAFVGIGYMDRAVVIPTWLGAYNKAVAKGLDEDAAIFEADKAVRQSQGAGAAKDLAAVQRGTGKAGEALKFLTMFYSYMSAIWQRQRTLGRDVVGAVRERDLAQFPELLARAWWLLIVPPLLSELLAGREPEEDEDWGLWALQRIALQTVGPIPVVRDVASALESGFGYKFTPAARGLETAISTVRDVRRMIEGEETKRATRNALETIGYATGLVPGQIATATQFLVDVGYGEQDPETVADWWEGLTKGKLKED